MLHKQAGVHPEAVPFPNQRASLEGKGLLGKAVFPESVLSGKTAWALPDLLPLVTEPGTDYWV